MSIYAFRREYKLRKFDVAKDCYFKPMSKGYSGTSRWLSMDLGTRIDGSTSIATFRDEKECDLWLASLSDEKKIPIEILQVGIEFVPSYSKGTAVDWSDSDDK